MYKNNQQPGTSTGSSASLPPFSTFLDSPQLSMGTLTVDIQSRQLSPGMPTRFMGSGPQQHQSLSAFLIPTPTGVNSQSFLTEGFDESEKEKRRTSLITNNLANFERFSQRDKQMFDASSMYGQGMPPNNNDHNGTVGSQIGNIPTPLIGAFFDSTSLPSNHLMEFRQVSPQMSTSLLNGTLLDSPKSQIDSLDQPKYTKKAVSVMSNLMNAERLTQKKKTDSIKEESNGPSLVPPPMMFSSVEQTGMRPPSQPGNNNANSNIIRNHRMSSDDARDMFHDLPTDFNNYSFSPDMRMASIGDSPLHNNLRALFPSFGASYGAPNYFAAQGMGTPNWATPQFPQTSCLPPLPPQPPQHQKQQHAPANQEDTGEKNGAKRQAKQQHREEAADDEEFKPKKKAKKAAKLDDPSEPRITSKHRGVCWYKRTKKWVVQTKVNGKRVHVGYFDDEEKAAEAYKNAVQGIQVKKAMEAQQKALGGGSSSSSDDKAQAIIT